MAPRLPECLVAGIFGVAFVAASMSADLPLEMPADDVQKCTDSASKAAPNCQLACRFAFESIEIAGESAAPTRVANALPSVGADREVPL